MNGRYSDEVFKYSISNNMDYELHDFMYIYSKTKFTDVEFNKIVDDVVEKLRHPDNYISTYEVAFDIVDNDDRFFLIDTVAVSKNENIR